MTGTTPPPTGREARTMTMHNPPNPPLVKGGWGDLEDELKMAYRISLIRGDGIGPEITEATLKVIEVTTED